MVEPTVDVRLTPEWADQTLRTDVGPGLTASPKWLPPKWFYDVRGSELFEHITRLPEYYPTRTERAILADHAETSRNSPGHRRSSSSDRDHRTSRPIHRG